uniref:Geranylgeranyl transferase type-2 subunit alpha n=1 Tax=Ananas comosus var. bracteatus TaxID=296719 RepID=A0A6V7PN44_ANACO|nr:unnamed protein product [Ananas comosus var. bracteatus]
MHGRPRRSPKPEDAAAAAAKASKLHELQSLLLQNHQNRIYTKEALLASSKLIEVNPEIYTAWNYRKLALQHSLNGVSDPEAIKSAVEDELRVVEAALRRNPKSYGAWYHRKWVLNQKLAEVDFGREFRLLDQLLKADARNFHGWSYRRFVTRLKNVLEEEELGFTMDMINTNFSNYSAWHNRSILLSHLLGKKANGFESKEKILSEELELVRQALFTDPSDQSGWFYHLWLLDQTCSGDQLKLISSWPIHQSKLVLPIVKEKDNCNSFLYPFQRETLPIVLYFNKPVKGITSSTVMVSSELAKNEDLTWKPLLASNSGEANCWATYLMILEGNCSTSQTFSVEVEVGCSEGIVSVSGLHYNPSKFKFSVEFDHNVPEQAQGNLAQEPFSWNYSEKFYSQENSDFTSFDQLKINDDALKEDLKWHLDTLSEEITLFKEMSEENCKFVKLTLARLLIAYDAMKSPENSLLQKRKHCEEALELFDDLIKLDPSHKRYYEDEQSLVLLDQVTSDKESLVKYCWLYDNPNFSTFRRHNCLQLRRLSLTRVGFVERMLWVQILDLSHNKLRSIAGLEALQLLICLNLSNNQISSFTSLEPLKRLSSLKVLDLSFNEIGAHPVDTTRYLCSSPLSHTLDVKGIMEVLQKDNINVADHWEMILLFKSLNLKQLNMKGNPVSSENFGQLVTKILPSLHWVDGERVR